MWGMDPYRLVDMAAQLERQLARVADSLERMTGAGEDGLNRMRTAADGIGAAMESAARRGEVAFNLSATKTSQAWKRVFDTIGGTTLSGNNRLGEFGRAAIGLPSTWRWGTAHLPGYWRARGFTDAAKHLPSIGGINLGGIASTAMSPLGILTALVMAGNATQRGDADARKIMRQFDAVGDTRGTGGFGGLRLARISASLGKEFGADLRSSAARFAADGYGHADAFQKTGKLIVGLRDNALEMATGLDYAFKTASGEVAGFATKLSTDLNISLGKSVRLVRDLGVGARDSGISFSAYMGYITAATSALRLFNIEDGGAGTLAGAFGRMRAGFMGRGMSSQKASQLAGEGIQGLASSQANLSTGLKAVLGQRIGQSMGLNLGGLGALYQFETGFSEHKGKMGGSNFFQKYIDSLSGMLKTFGGRDEQYHALKSLMGFTPATAQAFLEYQKDIANGLTGPQKKKREEELAAALKKQASETPAYIRLLNEIKTALTTLLVALTVAIVSGISIIYESIKGLTALLIEVLPDSLGGDKLRSALQAKGFEFDAGASMQRIMEAEKKFGGAWKAASESANKIPGNIGKLLKKAVTPSLPSGPPVAVSNENIDTAIKVVRGAQAITSPATAIAAAIVESISNSLQVHVENKTPIKVRVILEQPTTRAEPSSSPEG